MQRLRANYRTFVLPFMLVTAGFWFLAPLLDVRYVYAAVNSLAFTISIAVVMSYRKEFWESIRLSRAEVMGGNFLVVGICQAWFSSGERGAFSYIYRFFGEPWWMRDTLFQAYMVTILVCAGANHIIAKGAIHGVVPRKNYTRLAWVGIASAIVMVLGLSQLDPTQQAGAGRFGALAYLPVPDEVPVKMGLYAHPGSPDLSLTAW